MPAPSTISTSSFRERVGALRNLRPFLAMVWATSPTLTAATIALRLVRALLPVATLYIGKLIIDDVVMLVQLPDKPTTLPQWLDSGHLNRLGLLLGAEFAVAVLADVLGRIVSLLDGLLAERVSTSSSVRLMEHAATLDLEDFEDAEFQDQLERARRQTSGRMTLMSQLFSQAQDLVTVASLAAGLIVFAPWLIVLLLVALVPAFLGEAHFNAKSYSLDFGRTPERRELDYVRQTAASAETAKEVKIFGLNGFLIDRYRRLATSFYEANRRLALRRAGWGGLFTTIGTIGYYFAYAYIAWRTLTGEFSVGDLTFLAGSFRRLRTLLESLLSGFSSVAGQALYLDDLFSFFEVQPEIHSPGNPLPFPKPIRDGFVFEDVGFIYPGAERWAVRHLSFTLKAGEVVALVGENGAGKTTLVKLLTRLYDPDEGRILLDGRDLRDYGLDELRGSMGVIFQDFVRYNLPAGDNIAVGRIEARGDRERIARAASRSQADEVIGRLAHGYDQMIGKRFKNGVELSGGEWQKIAIARAYMREAEVLILDEPTAALDARAEFEVFQRFKELSKGKTAVLISHRFSSVRMADRILVLAGGRVEAQGTHEQLLAQQGRYAELFELQAAGYR
ncbi:ABC transporter ATP-binding protein [Reyranella sp.]|jgi:ATP-binding cassette subfamily B protein|uniref:ABC transporter ATP-binding protein n=1 Tax=Reyranella sp. TaxID=1929291 RepID=UPI000BCAC261|nr:ABC transporter ATP-binding protein [Reyranella sp.]OYY38730.1 MAG: ABC transporter ATP-binding protein [Rhodospirillales bacterium 35-66-84]OYZ92242.1 MAG: ABC transporter ATP-binding protein [Rhodospirillales bacterium 24-66-33]OZB23646.1 MAG: ABC transporter ATP-binding protein [Rhodospirillales bacterium 39-66-50]HQS15431.1 ABC transporter ATP-binding protein [Reyranella sp.]HQT11957.1 ABC transporter ATP-binding protein [Reyranella sp.]